MGNEKYKTAKIAAIIVTLLMFSSTFLVFSNFTESTAKAVISSDLLQYEWVQSAVDSSRSSFNPGPGPTTPHIEWRTEIPYLTVMTGNQPVAFNGKVFVQDSIGSTYALNAATGDIIYKLAPATGSIAKLDSTYMLIGSKCYKIADGSLVWSGPSGFSQSQNPMNGLGVDLENMRVYSGSRCWSVANPAQPPTLLWNRATESDYGAYGIESTVIYGNGVIVYNTQYNYIRGVDAGTGKTLWTTATTVSDWVYGSSFIDGVFGKGDLNGNFYGWNITTGELMWTYNPGSYYNEFASSSGAAYGMFYEKNEDTYVYAINATTGELVWKYKGPGVAYSNTLTIAGGKVYAMTGENQYVDFATGEHGHSEFACLDAYTGEVIWTEPWENGPPFNNQCNAYGKLFIVPTASVYHSGVFVYRENPRYEVWCIGDTPKDWSMFLSDPENSGFGDGPTTLALKWKVETGGVVCSPALANGVAYVGSMDGNMYAFNADTGAQVWNYSIGMIGFSSTPAVVNGRLYTGADDGKVYCLDAATGAKVWEANAGGVHIPGFDNVLVPTGAGSPTVVGDRVYVCAGNKRLYCLNAFSGAVIWTYNTTGDIAKMTPTVAGDAVYFGADGVAGDAGPHVIKLNATTGEEIFNVVIPGFTLSYYYPLSTHAPVTLGGGLIFARAYFRYNYALNATTGEIVWMVDARYNPGTPEQNQGSQQCAPMLYKYGIVYFTDFYGITAVDAVNGSELWHTYLSRENNSPAISYSYGRIYTVNEAGGLYVLDALSGEKLSYYQLAHTTLKSVPTPYNGSLYLGSRDWNFYCFDEAITPAIVTTNMSLSLSANSVTKGGYIYITGGVSQINYPVNITLTIDRPDSLYVDIPVTTDPNGNFMVIQTFDVIGESKIVAWWNGDETHTAACSETLPLTVVEPEVAPQPEYPQPIDNTWTIVGVGIVLLIAIVIVGILLLRKK
jgi:outer membrane protein assembly factor BamB